MNSNTLTVEELQAELAEMQEMQADRRSYDDAVSNRECDEKDARRMASFAARRAVYGENIWEAEAAAELGIGGINQVKEAQVSMLVSDILGLASKPKRFAIGAARIAAFENDAARRAVGATINGLTVGATGVHREDLETEVIQVAAEGVTTRWGKDIAAPINTARPAAYRILAGMEALVPYLSAAVATLRTAKRGELGFKGSILAGRAADALDNLRYGYAVTEVAGREARALAAAKARLGDDVEALAAFNAQRLAKAEASENNTAAKVQAVHDAEKVLALRAGASMDAEEGAPLLAASGEDARERVLREAATGIWDRLAPQFGYATGAELAVAVEWLTADGARKAAFTEFYATNAEVVAARRKAKALDGAAVQAAFTEEVFAVA